MDKKTLVKSFLLAAAAGGIALSANAIVIDGDSGLGFESPVGAGNLPDGWAAFGALGAGVVTDNVANGGFVFAGNQSVIASGGSQGISRPASFGTTGMFEWMFYDDLSVTKNVRVGLGRTGDNAPRFGALAVETNQSETHYVAHSGFGFTVTGVERVEGWHHMSLEWEPDVGGSLVQYYIDGALAHTAVVGGNAIAFEFIGSPFANASAAWVDVIPEPSTYALIFGGLALLGAFVYRRRAAAKA